MLTSAPNSLDVDRAFRDQNGRGALEYGIDRNAIGKVLVGTIVPEYAAIPSANFAALTKTLFGVSSSQNAYPFEPNKGKVLLGRDGWKLNAQSVMRKTRF